MTTMTAVEIAQPGGPEVLTPVSRPVPEPGAGQVLIKVAYAGVNRPDALQRAGAYAPPPGACDLPGLEASGEVAALGRGCERPRRRRSGLRAAARRRICRICRHPGRALPAGARGHGPASRRPACPRPISPSGPTSSCAAACRPASGFWCMADPPASARRRSSLRSHFGARVFATAGSAEKCAACTELGAERAINYREEDFVEVLQGRGRRGPDPRHGGRRLYPAQRQGAGG